MSGLRGRRRAVNESAESMTLDPAPVSSTQTRCRICRNDQVRTIVNGLLARPATPRSFAPSETTTPRSTSVIGDHRFDPQPCDPPLPVQQVAPPLTVRSSNAGHRKRRSTS
jgi:hypothetical protein